MGRGGGHVDRENIGKELEELERWKRVEAEKDSGGGMARWEAWFNLFGGFSKPLTAHFLSLLNGSCMNGGGGLGARFFFRVFTNIF